MSATNNSLQAFKVKQQQLTNEMSRSSRRVLWFMLALGVWFYVADALNFSLFSHDFMTNVASGLLTGALVFWAVDIG